MKISSIGRFAMGLTAVAIALGSASSAFAANKTWSKGASSTTWSTSGNWTPGGQPAAGDTATFGSTGQGIVNLLSASNRLSGMTVQAGTVYNFTGNAIRFNGGTTLTNNGTATFNLLNAFGSATLTIAGTGTSTVKGFATDGGSGAGTLSIASVVNMDASSPNNATALQVTTGGQLNVGTYVTTSSVSVTDGNISGFGDGVSFMDVTANGVYLNGGTTTMYIKDVTNFDKMVSQDIVAEPVIETALNYGGTLDLDLSVLAGNAFISNTQYQLFKFDPAQVSGDFGAVQFSNAGSTPYSSVTWSGPTAGVWQSTAGTNGQYFIFDQNTGYLVVVPEPSTIVFAGIGVGMAGWSAWKKRRLAKVLAKK